MISSMLIDRSRNPRSDRWARQSGRAFLVLLAVSSSALRAQAVETISPDQLKRMSLEELMDIEVTSVSRRREPLAAAASAIQVITRDDIRRSGATSIPEALRLANNLDVARKNSHDWAISARGFNTELANKLLVMIDGRTVYTPLFSGVFWDRQNYLLEDIERIEVISGPGGTLWGANAVNGVINIITRSSSQTHGLVLDAVAGTQAEGGAGLRYGGALAEGVDFRVYAMAVDRADEAFANGDSSHDAWRTRQAGFRLDAAPSSRDSISLQGDAYGGDLGTVAGGTSRVNGNNLLGRWTRALDGNAEFSLQIYYDRTHLHQPVPAAVLGGDVLAPAGVLVDNLDTYDIDFQHRRPLGSVHQLVWGLGYRATHDAVHNAPALAFLPARLNQDLYSGFVQDEIRLHDDVLFTAGTKVEHNDYTGWEFEPGMRLQWNPADGPVLWAALSRAVRAPSRIDRDLSQPGPGGPLVILRGSDGFQSENVVASELGARTALGNQVSATLSLFYNDYRDLRSTGITPTTVVPFVFENGIEGHTYGAELSVHWQPTDNWRLQTGLAQLRESLRVKPGSIDINQALNEVADPRHRFSLRSSWDLADTLELDLHFRRIGERPIHSGPTPGAVEAYSELDLRLAWRPVEAVELSLVGQNLLHRQHHEYGFPSADQIEIQRSVHGRVTWRFD